MSIFLAKTPEIRGGWGQSPQTPLASGDRELCLHTPVWGTPFAESWTRQWKSLWSFAPPKFWAGYATGYDVLKGVSM